MAQWTRVMWRRVLDMRPRTVEDRNAFLLSFELMFGALLGAAGSFNSAYVLRSGGSNTVVGFLSSLPSLVAVLLFLPAARILEKRRNYAPVIMWSLLASRLGYSLIIILPWVLSRYVPEATVGVLVAMTAPAVLFSAGWSPLLTDVVAPERRAAVLSSRSIINSGVIAIATFLGGRWLDSHAFPSNYQALYAVGLVGAMISTWLCSRIVVPDQHLADAPDDAEASPEPQEQLLASVRSLLLDSIGFRRICVNTLLFNLGAWTSMPLLSIFWVRELGATDSWLGLRTTMVHAGIVIGFLIWRRIINKVGEINAMYMMGPLVAPYALLVALFPNLTVIMILSFAINVMVPGFNLGHGVLFLGQLPEDKKHTATALYSMMMHIGAFAGPLIGVAVSGKIGVATTLAIAGSLRLAGVGLFYLFPIKGERPNLLNVWRDAGRQLLGEPRRRVRRR